MTPENVLTLIQRSEEACKFSETYHCRGCAKNIPFEAGEWCDICWESLTSGLQ